uniref:Uncharacterized protein LOC111136500 n=1 Tax=Crassostrea virginica TaxID=6565 RepID=A0A8B8ET13_CRAVI|nr:uncharacterized protein LOC111136500 [Crassostrea virginica]
MDRYILMILILRQASITAEKICWKTDDPSSEKDVFFRCKRSMIVLEDAKINENSVNGYGHCSSRIKQLLKCNGLKNICDVSNEDIFNIVGEIVDNCFYARSSSCTLCIFYNCISGEPNYLMDKTILTKVQGNVYKAAWVRGILHCSIYGHITNITVYKMPSTEITIRDNSGSKIIDFDDEFYSRGIYYRCDNGIEGMQITKDSLYGINDEINPKCK